MDFATKILTAKLGYTHIFSVGQAGFIIKSATGSLLGIDLYLSNAVERMENDNGFKRLLPKLLSPDDLEFDAVICTHPHIDHFDIDSAPYFLANGKTKMYCSVDCLKLVENLNLSYYNKQIRYVSPGDKEKTNDLNITFTPCDHGESAPDAVGVMIETNGVVIYEAGDTALRLDWKNRLPNSPDILIAPINGKFGNMNAIDAASLSEALKPKLTIPCHYGMFATHHGDFGDVYDFWQIMSQKKLNFLIMQQGECYTIRNKGE